MYAIRSYYALVNKLVSRSLTEKAPEVAAFLKNYKTTVAENNEP